MLNALVRVERTFVDSFMAIVEDRSHRYREAADDEQVCIISYHFISSRHRDTLLLICSFQLLYIYMERNS